MKRAFTVNLLRRHFDAQLRGTPTAGAYEDAFPEEVSATRPSPFVPFI